MGYHTFAWNRRASCLVFTKWPQEWVLRQCYIISAHRRQCSFASVHVSSPTAVQFYVNTTRQLTDSDAILRQCYVSAHQRQCSFTLVHVSVPTAVQFYVSTTRQLTDCDAGLCQYYTVHTAPRLQCSFTSVLHVSLPTAVQFYVSTTRQLTDCSRV